MAYAAVFRPKGLFIHELVFWNLLGRAGCLDLLVRRAMYRVLCRAIAANGGVELYAPMTLATTVQILSSSL